MAGIFDGTGLVLVVAPHPDDEILGCGGTMARLADAGAAVHVAIVTRGEPPRFALECVATVRGEADEAHARLGVQRTHYLDFPAAELDRVAHADLNEALGQLFASIQPATVFLPFVGDVHLDHQLVFHSGLVAARPSGSRYPVRLYAYETLSETNWSAPYLGPPFVPNMFVDISETLDRKIMAFAAYRSQCRDFPSERSPEALRALATLRGATVHRHAAEGFILVREVQ